MFLHAYTVIIMPLPLLSFCLQCCAARAPFIIYQ